MISPSWLTAALAFAIVTSGCSDNQKRKLPESKDLQIQTHGSTAKHVGEGVSAKGDKDTVPQAESIDDAQEDAETLMAIEPVSIGGAFLVCLEQNKGAQSTALCRVENETGQRIPPPQEWMVTYFVQTKNAKVVLESKNLPMEDPNFSWQLTLGKYKLASVMVEILDNGNGNISVTAPIPMDTNTMAAKPEKDPRVKK